MPARRSPWSVLLSGLLVSFASVLAAACAGDQPLAPAEPAPPSAPPAVEATPVAGDLAALASPRIAFMSSRYNNHPNVFTMDPSGNNVVRLTSWLDLARTPAWSYDNKRIAVVRMRRDSVANVWRDDIFIMNADGSNKRWVRPTPFLFSLVNPSWSPDGTRLVVSVVQQGGPYLAWLNVATGDIAYVSPAAGGPIGREAAFDPTGKKIIYVGKDYRSIERINVDGSGRTTVFSSATVTYRAPRYSPDGKRIAFSKTVNGDYELFVKNADGTVKRLTTSTYFDGEPAWSPDGSKIAFTSSRTSIAQVWVIGSNGGTATRLTHTSYTDTSPAWSH